MNDTERTVRRYLARSAGNCNHLSDHVLRRFVNFVEREDFTLADFQRVGGRSLAELVARNQKRFGMGWDR